MKLDNTPGFFDDLLDKVEDKKDDPTIVRKDENENVINTPDPPIAVSENKGKKEEVKEDVKMFFANLYPNIEVKEKLKKLQK